MKLRAFQHADAMDEVTSMGKRLIVDEPSHS
jgi:hypothetical protein